MIPIRFGPQVCGHLDEGAKREWLVPDGLGGYATGTVSGLRTRRYHGLLMVAGDTPAARHLAVAELDATVTLPSGARVPLATHEWADRTVHPRGFELLESFDLTEGVPRWRWRLGDVVVERELTLVHGRPCLAVVHRLLAGGPVTLTVEALTTWRDAHGERYASGPAPDQVDVSGGAVVDRVLRLSGPGWRPAGSWWLGAHYREEAARGLQSVEDLWHAGGFSATLAEPGDTAEITAWTDDLESPPERACEAVAAARARARQVVATAGFGDAVAATLALAADAFVVRTAAGPDVVAGYPWFGAWSRDTMTSYEGLFLCTRRADEGRELLRNYVATLSDGMLANTADTGRTEYNTVDATLWLLHAIDRHVTLTGDTDLANEVLPGLLGVVEHHIAGTRFGIKVDPADGLLTQGPASPAYAGDPHSPHGEALTWMDARIDGVPVTPRSGKPVEVNALWINGLTALERLAVKLGADPGPVPYLVARARESFRRRFPVPELGWLHDLVDGLAGDDSSLRPNQLLAWSLPYAPLEPDVRALRLVGAALLTPLGPRSLAPGSPGYAGLHRGGSAERDRAYHQGTVWPWLLGPYADVAGKIAAAGDARDLGGPDTVSGMSARAGRDAMAGVPAASGGARVVDGGVGGYADGDEDGGRAADATAALARAAGRNAGGSRATSPILQRHQTEVRNVTATIRNGYEIDGLFSGIEAHLTEFGLGSVSETADGQPPHAATGCPFQAWSVAEVLRARRF